MKDLTILYYSASLISDFFGDNVRKHLLETTMDQLPIVSVTQKPLDFGRNICVGVIGATVYNVYKQILTGAKWAETKYVVCCEDDTLYNPEHFEHRPPADTFAYSKQRWILDPDPIFRWRDRTGMCTCIVETRVLIDRLEEKFAAYPKPPRDKREAGDWGEPGRYERNLGLPHINMEIFNETIPLVTFNHKPSLRGIRSKNQSDILKDELPYWGKAKDLWERIHG